MNGRWVRFPAWLYDLEFQVQAPSGEWLAYGHGYWTCSLYPGMNGEAVKQLQRDMNTCYLGVIGWTPLQVDGGFGPKTTAALRKVQTSLGIGSDGEYGRVTSRTMNHEVYDQWGSQVIDCKTLAEMGFPGDNS